MAEAFPTVIELDDEAWERFQYEIEHYDWDKYWPPERIERLKQRAKELGMDADFSGLEKR
jgi:hypothetical protein